MKNLVEWIWWNASQKSFLMQISVDRFWCRFPLFVTSGLTPFRRLWDFSDIDSVCQYRLSCLIVVITTLFFFLVEYCLQHLVSFNVDQISSDEIDSIAKRDHHWKLQWLWLKNMMRVKSCYSLQTHMYKLSQTICIIAYNIALWRFVCRFLLGLQSVAWY